QIDEENSSPLWTLMNVSYQVINKTHPELTKECWLCFNTKPPYFEDIGISNRPSLANGSNPRSCRWENGTQGISLQQIRGQGRCIG
ncbi:ENV1 protein, partial [Nyctibius grandis]|nr:ENV1 protein [Nyctibius grandis]